MRLQSSCKTYGSNMKYRSDRVTKGQGATAARSLFRAAGVKNSDFGKPIIAVANSFTEFVPGHVHLNEIGRIVCDSIWDAGGIPREFNTIAVDDGIAMGHDGMLYSLPSRELIADSIEYMVNAHCADAMICISNCDKITPGMLIAAMRLNIPTIFVSGGPMEAGRLDVNGKIERFDLSDAFVSGTNPSHRSSTRQDIEENACPTCGSCSGMFTANSMNCLAEALGLALPGNGSLLATHALRRKLFVEAGKTAVDIAKSYYVDENENVLPRALSTRSAFMNAMSMDIAMGGSTNTILHLLAIAHEANVEFDMNDINEISKRTPYLCKVAPASSDYFMEDVHKSGGVMGILGELKRAGLIDTSVYHLGNLNGTLGDVLAKWDLVETRDEHVISFFKADASGVRGAKSLSHESEGSVDLDRVAGCLRSVENAYSRDGGLAVLFGNIAKKGCIVKTGSVASDMIVFNGRARVFDSQDSAVKAIGSRKIAKGDVVVIRYEGPKGGPGMQEMLLPTTMLKAMQLDKHCALLTDGRFSGATSGLSVGHISPEAAAGGEIALIQEGDEITIDIPDRRITLNVDSEELDVRRQNLENETGYTPMEKRIRKVSSALRLYAKFASSADLGGVRVLPD